MKTNRFQLKTISFFMLVILVALLATSALADSAIGWSMFLSNYRHTGQTSMQGPDNPTLAWVSSITPFFNMTAVDKDGTIYAEAINGVFYALNSDGSIKWTYVYGGDQLAGSPAIGNDGSIYFMAGRSNNGKLYSLDTNGNLNWIFDTQESMANFAGATIGPDGNIYFSTYGGTLYSLNPSGLLIWSYHIPTYYKNFQYPPSLASDGTVYSVGSDGQSELFAFSSNGNLLWKIFLAPGDVNHSPVIGNDGTIYITGWDPNGGSHVFALNPDSTQKWDYFFDYGNMAYAASAPALSEDGNLYIGWGQNIYSLNSSNGALNWEYPTETAMPVTAAITLSNNGTVFAQAGNYIYALSPQGNLVWKYASDGYVAAYPPSIYNGRMYLLNVTMDENDNSQFELVALGELVITDTPTPPPFAFSGFYPPIDNLPLLNTMHAGRVVPVKFSLGGFQGLDIITSGYPASSTVDCGNVAEDAVEVTTTTGNRGLSYDADTDQYTYLWKTDKSWSRTCRTLVIKFTDNTIHRANFKFK